MSRPIFLLTDFGNDDHYAGQVRAVLTRLAPLSRIIDLTHGIAPFAVDHGAWTVEITVPHLPDEAVLLAVVDPGVGGPRPPVALKKKGRFFVGPDNGLFAALLPPERRRTGTVALAGTGIEARLVDADRIGVGRERVSTTFHGRDLFAPAAARLARGEKLKTLGPPVRTMRALPPFRAERQGGVLRAAVVHIDRYGNLITTLHASQLSSLQDIVLVIRGRQVGAGVLTFEEIAPGALAWHVDSSGFVAVASRERSAASILGAKRGDPVLVLGG